MCIIAIFNGTNSKIFVIVATERCSPTRASTLCAPKAVAPIGNIGHDCAQSACTCSFSAVTAPGSFFTFTSFLGRFSEIDWFTFSTPPSIWPSNLPGGFCYVWSWDQGGWGLQDGRAPPELLKITSCEFQRTVKRMASVLHPRGDTGRGHFF